MINVSCLTLLSPDCEMFIKIQSAVYLSITKNYMQRAGFLYLDSTSVSTRTNVFKLHKSIKVPKPACLLYNMLRAFFFRHFELICPIYP